MEKKESQSDNKSDTENIVVLDQKHLALFAEKICTDPNCRYPLVALRILVHSITSVNKKGHIYISARRLSKSMGVHYDTVTKSLKYLRGIGILNIER
jgi:hypothetical protein